jgi:hypothetical protein
MNKLTYEEYLERYGEITYTNVGTSMMPMIKQGRDLFTLVKKTEKRCQKYDVVLYCPEPSHYVLHRIVAVRDHDYVILGDNCIEKEYGITDEQIIAVLSRFVHKGKTYSVDDKGYRLYARLWYAIYPVRQFIMRGKRKLLRMRGKRK